MRYTIRFAAIDGSALAQRMKNNRDVLLDEIRQKMNTSGTASNKQIDYCISLSSLICEGDIPRNCNEDYFIALWWLAATAGEEIILSEFTDVRGFTFFVQVGLWPLLLKTRPPFPTPKSSNFPPGVGYLSWEKMQGNNDEDIEELLAKNSRNERRNWGPTHLSDMRFGWEKYSTGSCDGEVKQARQQFAEVSESVIEDQLDLLAIV